MLYVISSLMLIVAISIHLVGINLTFVSFLSISTLIMILSIIPTQKNSHSTQTLNFKKIKNNDENTSPHYQWTEIKMKNNSFPGMSAWVGSVNQQGTGLYFRWGPGPDNALLIDTGKIHNDKRIYAINNIFYTNSQWHNIQCLNQILNGRETNNRVKNPVNFYVPTQTKKSFDDLITAFHQCNNSNSLHYVKENELGVPILLGDRNTIRITPFETYYKSSSNGYLIEFLENLGNDSPKWTQIAAITGETTIETYSNPDNKFLQSVPYLFTDITFFDKTTSIYESVVKGHIHLDQLNNLSLQNKHVIGYNFSDKFSKDSILEKFSNDSKYENYIAACNFHS